MANVNTVTTKKTIPKASAPVAKPATKHVSSKSNPSEFGIIIIGAGGSGLAAGMYAARLGMTSLILGATQGYDLPVGGVITTTHVVENYPGFTTLTGPELAKHIEDHTRTYKEVTIKEERVSSVSKSGKGFVVKTGKGEYNGKMILFATGTKWKKLPESVKGSKEFENKGVHYCALCDGPLYKNKIVSVIGGSDSAAKDALLLAEHATKVYIIYRGEKIRPEPINLKRIEANKKIEVINSTNIIEVKGEKLVTGVVLDKVYKNSKEMKLDGIFVAIGHIILSELAKPLGVKLNRKGEIMINHMTSETSVPGVFAAGDVTDKAFKQLITGVADGCTAAHSAYEYLGKSKIEVC